MPVRGHRPSSSLTGLMVFEHNDNDDDDEDQSPHLEAPTTYHNNTQRQTNRRSVSDSVAASTTTQKSSSALLPLSPLFITSEKRQQQQKQQKPPHRTVSLCIFVSSLLGFCVVALALGLGLGLGLGLRSWHHNNNNKNENNVVYGPSPPLSNYTDYYGVPLPTDLEMIPVERLVNRTELDLDTGFIVAKAEDDSTGGGGGGGNNGGSKRASMVREYTFDITQALAAPDGFLKPMILVNGQSPGPLIEANMGDVVRVRVNNRLLNVTVADNGEGGGGGDGKSQSENEGGDESNGKDGNGSAVTIHWHGIDQHGTPWMDGVAGVSQCGVPAGSSFTYEFHIDGQRGTFWWHAHLSVQYSDGVYGPIVIHDPEEMVPNTDDEKIIFVSDIYHTYGSVLLESYLNTTSKWAPDESGVEPLPDNLLLNGQNTYDCSIISTTYPRPLSPPPPLPASAPASSISTTSSSSSSTQKQDIITPLCAGGQLYTTKTKSGSTVRLRLINASSFLSYWISVDNHTLTVVELDGIEVEPFVSSNGGVYLNIGQRASVILTANQTKGNYAIRATLPETCFLPYAPYENAGLRGTINSDDNNDDDDDDDDDDTHEKGGQRDEKRGGGGGGGKQNDHVKRPYEVYGILSYDHVDPTEEPIGRPGNTTNPYGVENNDVRGDAWEGCDDAPFDLPRPMRAEPAVEVSEANTHYIEYMFRQAQDVNRIFVNKTAYSPLPHNATLWKVAEQHFAADAANSYNSWDFGLNQQVLLVPDADKGVQIVINSRDNMEHPWHLHGHTFQIVGWGPGLFGAGENATTWNLENPMRRDTVTIPAFSHIVIRFMADNPGLWALHCHVAWHMEGGMFVSLVERPDDLVKLINDMDPETRRLSQSFCGIGDGQ